jgi:hypothetical protein
MKVVFHVYRCRPRYLLLELRFIADYIVCLTGTQFCATPYGFWRETRINSNTVPSKFAEIFATTESTKKRSQISNRRFHHDDLRDHHVVGNEMPVENDQFD